MIDWKIILTSKCSQYPSIMVDHKKCRWGLCRLIAVAGLLKQGNACMQKCSNYLGKDVLFCRLGRGSCPGPLGMGSVQQTFGWYHNHAILQLQMQSISSILFNLIIWARYSLLCTGTVQLASAVLLVVVKLLILSFFLFIYLRCQLVWFGLVVYVTIIFLDKTYLLSSQ